jgi:hypothetical protein
MDLEH